jgi:DNA-binding ferritin-like protein
MQKKHMESIKNKIDKLMEYISKNKHKAISPPKEWLADKTFKEETDGKK